MEVALAAAGVDPRSLPAIPLAAPQLTVPMAVPVDRQVEVEQASRAFAAQQRMLLDGGVAGDGPDFDGSVDPDPEEQDAMVPAAAAQPVGDALRYVMPHDNPARSLLFEALAAPAPPCPKLPPHPVWGPRWLPAVVAMPDFSVPVRDIQGRGNRRNVEEAVVLFSALSHLRDHNIEAVSELLARRALGLWYADKGDLPWEAVSATTSLPGLVIEPVLAALPQEALQHLQRRLALTAAIRKSASAPEKTASVRKQRYRKGRGGQAAEGAAPGAGAASGANGGGGQRAGAPSDRRAQ